MDNIKNIPRKQQFSNANFLSPSELREILIEVEKSKDSKTSAKINSDINNELSSMTKSFIPNCDGMSVAKVLEVLEVTSKPDVGVSENNNIATPNLSEIPTFNQLRENQHDDFGIPASEVGAIINRKAKRSYDNSLLSIENHRTLQKADEYGIEYDINKLNFVTLPEKIAEFEELIIDAEEVGINWEDFGYDVMGIVQKIEELTAEEFHHNQDLRWDYLGSTL